MEYFILASKIILTLFNIVFILGVISGGFYASLAETDISVLFSIICFLGFIGNICFIWGIL